jgi:hypothetical protein
MSDLEKNYKNKTKLELKLRKDVLEEDLFQF